MLSVCPSAKPQRHLEQVADSADGKSSAHRLHEALGDVEAKAVAFGLPGAVAAYELLGQRIARQEDGILRGVSE